MRMKYTVLKIYTPLGLKQISKLVERALAHRPEREILKVRSHDDFSFK